MSTDSRSCTNCGDHVPVDAFACPTCGKYFDGGFSLGDLVEGVRAGEAEVIQLPVPTEEVVLAEAELWRPAQPRFATRHLDLPHVPPPTDLPYATDDEAQTVELAEVGHRRWGRRRS